MEESALVSEGTEGRPVDGKMFGCPLARSSNWNVHQPGSGFCTGDRRGACTLVTIRPCSIDVISLSRLSRSIRGPKY